MMAADCVMLWNVNDFNKNTHIFIALKREGARERERVAAILKWTLFKIGAHQVLAFSGQQCMRY